ncbi:MAG: hypothetical protein ACP5N7_05475 [Candidatus Pacearchaeota archaeon]
MKKFVPPSQKVPSPNKTRKTLGKRVSLNHTITGLPPGAIATLYDKLHQVFDNGTYTLKAVGTYVVDEDGILRLSNLRDSIYSLRFQDINYITYDLTSIQIGDPTFFQTTLDNEIPFPVIATGLVTGLDIENQAFLTVYWILDTHQTQGYYEIWLKKSGQSYLKHTTLYTPQARSHNIQPLDYSTLYYVKLKTISTEGLSRGFSNELTATTLADPSVSGVMDSTTPTGADFFI